MAFTVNGATRVIFIIGDPIAQVKSPEGMTKAFAARGKNAVVVPAHVAPRDLAAFVAGASLARNIDGILVTIPHKFACHGLCAQASARADFLGAVQTMRRLPGGGWEGDNFDGLGFLAGMRARGYRPEDSCALLIGAGGAGTAIAAALIEAGVSALAVHDDDHERRGRLTARLRTVAKVPVTEGSRDPAGFTLVCNATPAGMRAGDPLPVDVARLSPDAFVGCVITAPAVSPLIVEARKIGCRTSVGADMYVAVQELMLEFLLAGEITMA